MIVSTLKTKIIIKAVLFVSIFFFLFPSIEAQQKSNSYMYDKLAGIYNPSSIPDVYYKYNYRTIIGLSTKSQWGGVIKGPKTQSVSIEYITKSSNTFNLLIGSYLLNDKIGPISSTGIYFKVANFMSKYDSRYGGISAGIQFGAIQYRINTQSLYKKYPNDILTQNNSKVTNPELSLGISYYKIITSGFLDKMRITTGVSIAQLGFNQLEFKDENNGFSIRKKMHTYGYLKVNKPLSDFITLELSSWTRYVKNTPLNIDIIGKLSFNDTFIIEGGTNSSGIAHFGFGLNMRKLFSKRDNLISINYSFNPSLINYGSLLGNTHEITVVYSGNKM